MGVVEWIRGLWKKEAVHYVVAVIPDANVSPAFVSADIKSERHYFRIWLAEMFLRDDRRLFREYVPVVHSSVRLTYGGATKEFPYVAGPQQLNLGAELGEGIQIDHRLTNLLPFRGGAVDITAALVAYKEKDFFRGFLDVMNDVAGMLNAGPLAASLKVAETAVSGVQNLLGAGEKDVHLLFFRGFAGTGSGGNPLRSGYTAVIRADANRFDSSRLYVKESRLFQGASLSSAQPLQGYDYMLLRIESVEERDDFMSFPVFETLLLNAIREGRNDQAKGQSIIETAEVLVWESTDLTVADRYRVAKALADEYGRAMGPQPEAAPDVEAPGPDLWTAVTAVETRPVAGDLERLAADEGAGIDSFRRILRQT